MAGVSTPFGYARVSRIRPLLLPRPARRHAAGLGIVRFRSPLLAESLLFSLPAGTEMFQFPALALALPVSLRTGFPIRTSADLFVFADPRGFSQLVTSFLASGSLRHPPCALIRFPFFFSYAPRLFTAAALSLLVLLLLLRVHHVNDLSFVWRITDSNR